MSRPFETNFDLLKTKNQKKKIVIFDVSRVSASKTISAWAVVVAQLVEWSLPTLEVRRSNPVIGKI